MSCTEPNTGTETGAALPNHLLQPPFQTVPSSEGLWKTQPAASPPVLPRVAALPALGTRRLSSFPSWRLHTANTLACRAARVLRPVPAQSDAPPGAAEPLQPCEAGKRSPRLQLVATAPLSALSGTKMLANAVLWLGLTSIFLFSVKTDCSGFGREKGVQRAQGKTAADTPWFIFKAGFTIL